MSTKFTAGEASARLSERSESGQPGFSEESAKHQPGFSKESAKHQPGFRNSVKNKSIGEPTMSITEQTVDEIVEFINKKIDIPFIPESVEALIIKAVIMALFHILTKESIQHLQTKQ